MNFKSLKDLDVRGKRVLLRADLNVPARRGRVTDTTRIDRLKPTIDFLRKEGAKTLILSHFGRPEGEQNPEMSLAFLLPTLEERWGGNISFAPDCIGEKAYNVVQSLQDGDIALLENLRFHKGEKANDPAFAEALARLGDVYVNDAFSAAHRAHASTEGLAHILPTAAGILLEEELNALNRALEAPQRPVVAIVGGSKISTKINVLKNLSEKVDYIIPGGGMANTFLYACGGNLGSSLCEKDMVDEARAIMTHAQKHNCQFVLPLDVVCVKEIKNNAPYEVVDAGNVPEGYMAVDAGPRSLARFSEIIQQCRTVVWNGPLGIFEIPPFDEGTSTLAKIVARQTAQGAIVSIAGGGDTVAALENAGVCKELTYVSTAGGAFLEWLEGKPLPGIVALGAYEKAA